MTEGSPPKEEIYALALICAALISGKIALAQGPYLARDAKAVVKELLRQGNDEAV